MIAQIVDLVVVATGQVPGIVECGGRVVLLVPCTGTTEALRRDRGITLSPHCQWAGVEAVEPQRAGQEPREPWPLLESD